MAGWSPQQPVSKVLQRGQLAKHFEYLKLAKRIAAIVSPVCEHARLGVPITPDCLKISRQLVRNPAYDGYEIDLEEDPRQLYQEKIVLQIGLPNNACITKFKQFQPSVAAALAQRGFGALVVQPVLDNCGHHPAEFLTTEPGKPIGGAGAYEGAKALSERLPDESPLKESMRRLAESLQKHKR